jgi:hypothetical protein
MSAESIDYSAIIADLEAKRAALDATIGAFRAAQALGALGQPGEASGTTTMSFSASGGEIPVGAFLGKSIPEAAKLCLTIVKRKQTSAEIAEGLKKGGIESTAKNFAGIVHSILSRASKSGSGILKLDRSYWGLADWYPAGMRGGAPVEKKARTKKRRARAGQMKAGAKATSNGEQSKPKALGSGAVSRIAEVLRRQPGNELSPEEIATPANVSVQVARMMLGRLVAGKQAEKTGSGKYRAIAVN